MPINKTKYNCSGCTACASICPQHCINMVADAEGFKYPEVDLDRCTGCDLCVKKCPFTPDYSTSDNFSAPIAIAGRSKRSSDLTMSSSGGAFAVLSDWILQQGGVVYGVAFDEHFVVKHQRAVTKEQRDKFRGSKYVQSDLEGVFQQVKSDLEAGCLVMFSGTPCQTAGLRAFIPAKMKQNLYVVDLICHGVPSPKYWQDYVEYLEHKEGKTLTHAELRDKELKGWKSGVETFCFNGGKKMTFPHRFYQTFTLRHSCYNCPFTNTRRPSDVTIGDCWGIEHTPAAHWGKDNRGVSLFLVNTLKGEKWMNNISDEVETVIVDLQSVLQPQLKQPTHKHEKRETFGQDYIDRGVEFVIKHYATPTLKERIKRMIKKIKR